MRVQTFTRKTRLAQVFALGVGTLFPGVGAAAAQGTPATVAAETPAQVAAQLAADLTWSQAERDLRFGNMGSVFPVHRIPRARHVQRLRPGARLLLPQLEAYLRDEHLAGVLLLQGGRVRAEQYRLGTGPATLWTGFSVTKALTDTLVGVALRQGRIHAAADPVTDYLPALHGSAYDGVTVRQLMTMTTGVAWNENYTSLDADNVRLYQDPRGVVGYMATRPRASAPGTLWHYNTGETDLLGVLLRSVTGKSLAEQAAAVWQAAGMAVDGTWISTAPGSSGKEFGGSGLSATLRDYGRLGQWVLHGDDNDNGILPAGWFHEAGRAQVAAPGTAGYGYGWWPQPDGSFAALGIFGQSILVDPARDLVIVTLGNWAEATGARHTAARAAFWHAAQAALDAEGVSDRAR